MNRGLSDEVTARLRALPLDKLVIYWREMELAAKQQKKFIECVRSLCLSDLYYLLVRGCGRKDMLHSWVYARVREVEASPDGHLDLWSREHYKSSIITFGLTIQDILKNPDITFGFFSHTRPIAKAFLRQIMRELEANKLLHEAFPDVLWGANTKAAPKWSEDDGIIVKRTSNPNEATIEAWGLVDGQPTSKHFKVLLYDDIVVAGSVTTPDMIAKTMTELERSYNLGTTPGIRRFAGTRWHFSDAYATIKQRGSAIPREHPGREGGVEEGRSVYWSDEIHEAKRRDMGPYTYACHAGGTPILMGDWSWKNIEDVAVGDEVVGFVLPKAKSKTRTQLTRTKVLATSSRIAEVTQYQMASGGRITCTPDHKWWSGRTGTDTHRVYAALGSQGYRDLQGLVKITERYERSAPLTETAAWLSGMIDGEGTISPQGQLIIAQSNEHNPQVCLKLEQALLTLGISYKIYQREANTKHGRNSKASRLYVLGGGRPMKHRIISLSYLAKREVFVNRGLYGRIGGRYADAKLDKVVAHTQCGARPVYNIQTETGNYIANGYASKNCQILLNPKADSLQGFRREWLRHYKKQPIAKQMCGYILVDAASSKKKGSDYTSIWVVGLNVDKNRYALDIVRDRLNLKERSDRIFSLHRKWSGLGLKIKQVRYEKYGLMSDIEHLQSRMEDENYRFQITEVAGQTSKSDRIKRLLPIFEQGQLWLPESLHVTDWQKIPVDLVHSFIEEEYVAFPVGAHDDMLDSLSRMEEPDLTLVWPMPEKPVKDEPMFRPMAAISAWMR